MADEGDKAQAGFKRTPFVPEITTLTRSECEYCQEICIAELRIVEAWEWDHRKICGMATGASAGGPAR